VYVPLVVSPENENAPFASLVAVSGVPAAAVSVIAAAATPVEVPACTTCPFRVNGAVCVVDVDVDVVVGAVADGLQPTTKAKSVPALIAEQSLMKGISKFYPSSTDNCRANETLDTCE
jgi:hypothetical protein